MAANNNDLIRVTFDPETIKRIFGEYPIYVNWRVDGQDAKGHLKKPPIPNAGTGVWPSSTDPETWVNFKTAWARVLSGEADGIGISLNKKLKLVVIDIDNCRNPEAGEIAPWAQDIINRADTVTEISSSGTGVHLYFKSSRTEFAANKGGNLEIYGQKRFIYVTGHLLTANRYIKEDKNGTIDYVVDLIKSARGDTSTNDKPSNVAPVVATDFGPPPELLENAEAVVADFLSNPTHRLLWEHDIRVADNSPSTFDLIIAKAAIKADYNERATFTLIYKNREHHGADTDKLFAHKEYFAKYVWAVARQSVLREAEKNKSEQDQESALCEQVLDWVNTAEESEIADNWYTKIYDLSPLSRSKVRQAVKERTGIGLTELRQQMKDVERHDTKRRKQRKQQEKAEAVQASGRAVVDWDCDSLPAIMETVKTTLNTNQHEPRVFDHGGECVSVQVAAPHGVRLMQKRHALGEKYPPTQIIRPYNQTTIETRLLQSIAFQTSQGFGGGCPTKVALNLIADPTGLPPLSGLLCAPTITPKGRVITKPGYDEETGLYCVFTSKLTAQLPEASTKEMAVQSLIWLRDQFFEGFPFAGERGNRLLSFNESIAVAFLLTAFVRCFLNSAPGFVITATSQASGKSTLADLIFLAAHGRHAAATGFDDNEEEQRKHLVAALREGQPGICFDNCPHGKVLESAVVASALTQPELGGRILGKSETITVLTGALIVFTGNQLGLKGDFASRLLLLTLQPKTERPEKRTHRRKDIEQWAEQHRAEIVGHVATVLQGYYQSTTAQERQQLGDSVAPSRFSEWDAAVRLPLLWAGAADPCDSFDSNRQEDPWVVERSRFLAAWYTVFGDKPVLLKDLIKFWHRGSNFYAIESWDGLKDQRCTADDNELCEALQDIFDPFQEHKGAPSVKALSGRLRMFKDRIIGGYQLKTVPHESKYRGAQKWQVIRVYDESNPDPSNDDL